MNRIPSELYDIIVTYLPERILLNKTWRSRFLSTDPVRESLFDLGLTMKVCRNERRQLARHRQGLIDTFFENLESDDPDPTACCRQTLEDALVSIERRMIYLRCKCERLNVVYTKRRALYLHLRWKKL